MGGQKGSRTSGIEFSKLALMIQFGLSVALTALVAVWTLLGKDISGLSIVTGGSYLSDGAVTSFYLWKAKTENRAKYAELFALRTAKEYGIEAAIQLTELILRD